MPQETLNNSEALSVIRGKINNNFTEVYTTKANLAGPTFTGVPAAPTATNGTNTTQIATTAFVQAAAALLVDGSPTALNTLNKIATALGNDAAYATTMTAALALKANLASPTFTGTPAAPTPTLGTNTTQLATTAFVRATVDAVLAGAPGALDTLQELAAALGNDPNYATTVLNALALKANLASPALSGTPTAPTAAPGTNTTQLATTAFVQAEAGTRLSLANGGTMVGTVSFQPGTSTVTANAATILLNVAPHRDLTLAAATGPVTCTITRAVGRTGDNYSGAILVTQHATTSRALTFALTGGTVRWCGAAPDFAAMTAGSQRLLSYIVFGGSNTVVLADCGVLV